MPYDVWHLSRPPAGAQVCREHGKVPSKTHGTGKRWQARWRDPEGRQLTELCRTETAAKK